MAGTATITLEASLTDSSTGETYALSASQSLPSMSVYDKRIYTADTTVRTIVTVNTAGSTGNYIFTSIRGFIIVNRGSDLDGVMIGYSSTGADTVYIKLLPGDFDVRWNTMLDANVTGAAYSAFVNINTITLQSITAASQRVEMILFH